MHFLQVSVVTLSWLNSWLFFLSKEKDTVVQLILLERDLDVSELQCMKGTDWTLLYCKLTVFLCLCVYKSSTCDFLFSEWVFERRANYKIVSTIRHGRSSNETQWCLEMHLFRNSTCASSKRTFAWNICIYFTVFLKGR